MHRVVPHLEPEREQPHRTSTSGGEHDEPDHGRERQPQQRGGHGIRDAVGLRRAREPRRRGRRARRGSAARRARPRRRCRRRARRGGSGAGRRPRGRGPCRRRGRGRPTTPRPPARGRTRRSRRPPRRPLRRRHRQQGAARTHPGVVADAHRADVQLAAVDPVAGQVDLGLDRAAGAEGEQAGDRRDAVQVDVAADPTAEQARVDLDQRRRRQARWRPARRRGARRARAAGARCRRGGGCPGWTPTSASRAAAAPSSDAAGRADEEQPAEEHPPPADVGQPVEAEHRTADQRAGAHPGEPAQGADRAEAERGQHLGDLGGQGHRQHGGVLAAGRGGHVVERGGEVGEAGVVVDVGDGDLGEALAQPAHELGGGEAPAAEVEEVVVGAGRRAAEDGGPVPGDPRGRARPRRAPGRMPSRPVARAAARAGRRGRSSRRCGSAGCRRRRAAGRARPASCDGAARRRPWRRRRARW